MLHFQGIRQLKWSISNTTVISYITLNVVAFIWHGVLDNEYVVIIGSNNYWAIIYTFNPVSEPFYTKY